MLYIKSFIDWGEIIQILRECRHTRAFSRPIDSENGSRYDFHGRIRRMYESELFLGQF